MWLLAWSITVVLTLQAIAWALPVKRKPMRDIGGNPDATGKTAADKAAHLARWMRGVNAARQDIGIIRRAHKAAEEVVRDGKKRGTE